MPIDLIPAFKTAWKEFGEYYRKSRPVASEEDGDTKTIHGERQAVQYLSFCLQGVIYRQKAIAAYTKLQVQEEFPVGAERLDLAVVSRSEWLDLAHVERDQRRLALAAEFKFLLHANDQTDNKYNLRAVMKDCRKLMNLRERADQLIMCIVIRRRTLPTYLESLVTDDFPDVTILHHHVPPQDPSQ
jgi:hypothetical protein